MTDIALPDQQTAVARYNDDAMDRLARWAERADAVFAIAEKICSTSFAPAAYRGKPVEAAAAMFAGAELGFDPMASLRAFHNIQGIPAPAALTLRAVVQGAGHDVEIVESTNERAVVRGRRHGRGEWQTSVWDVPRAQQLAQFKTNPNYKTNLAQMLCARATAEVCRWIAADAIMGMPYAAEEIEDQRVVEAPAVRRLTVAELDAPPAAEPADQVEMVTDKQRRHMFALWRDLGYDGDENRQNRLDITTKILLLTEPIESSNDLTQLEAQQVIEALTDRKNRTAGGES